MLAATDSEGISYWIPRPDGKIVHMSSYGNEFTKLQSEAFGHFSHLEKLVLDRSKVWDGRDLTTLHQAKQLWYFYARHGMFGDQGLANIGRCHGITDLELDGSQVTDDGLVHIAKLTKLRVLYLEKTQVKGPGLENLSGLMQCAQVSSIPYFTPI